METVVSKSVFAERCGVTRGRVSQWVRNGYIPPEALVGRGVRAKIKNNVAMASLRGCLDTSRLGSRAQLDDPEPVDAYQALMDAIRDHARALDLVKLAILVWAEGGGLIGSEGGMLPVPERLEARFDRLHDTIAKEIAAATAEDFGDEA